MVPITAQLLIFDLDGTLIDSKKDIAFAVNETLSRIDHPPLRNELIYQYVGNGVRPLIDRAVAATGGGNSNEKAYAIFKEIYTAHLLDTTVLFDGVIDVLKHFRGKKMAVASNKPHEYVLKIIEGLGVARFFISARGGDSVPEKKPHPHMLQIIMGEAKVTPAATVFIGDSAVDVLTGKNAGVRTIGATYGFRPIEELVESGPDILIGSPGEIRSVII